MSMVSLRTTMSRPRSKLTCVTVSVLTVYVALIVVAGTSMQEQADVMRLAG